MTIDSNSELLSQLSGKAQSFLQTLKSFERLVQKYHPNIQSYSETSLAKFVQLPEPVQNKIIGNFTSYGSFLAECSAQGMDLSCDPPLFSKYLKEFGFIFDKSAIQDFKKTDIIEVYSAETVQIFRNLRFFEVCSYTLLDLLVYEPYELYERSLKVNEFLMEAAGRLASRPFDLSPADLSHIPEHVLREKFSVRRTTAMVNFKKIYPLYRWPHLFSGFLMIQEGEALPGVTSDISFI